MAVSPAATLAVAAGLAVGIGRNAARRKAIPAGGVCRKFFTVQHLRSIDAD
jgi:hypothetical protein